MILQLALLGLALALAPLSLVAFLILVAADGGTRRGIGFIVGWVGAIVVVIALTLLVSGGKPPKEDTDPATGLLLAKEAIGLLLIGLGARRYRRRNLPGKPPAWRSRVGKLSPGGAAVFGFMFQPWAFVAAGAATIASADVSDAATLVGLVLFGVLATSSYLAIEGYLLASPAAARGRLDRLQGVLEVNTNLIISLLAVLVGLWLAISSLYLLITS